MGFLRQLELRDEILKELYIKNKPKVQVARDLKCSPTTVKKFAKQHPRESEYVQSKLIPMAEKDEYFSRYQLKTKEFRNLQITLYLLTDRCPVFKQSDILNQAVEIRDFLGINSPIDLIRLELAMESLVLYLVERRRFEYVNSENLDMHVVKNLEKMSLASTRSSATMTRHLQNFNSGIRELELKYGKRSPDFVANIRNFNIQKNEINL